MAVRFHTLTVADVKRETNDAISITFDVPEELRPIFLYKAGQYLTVKAIVDGVEHRRNYSLCSSPVDNEPLMIAVKKVRDGAVSQWLNEDVKPGMKIEVYPPMGNFTKELDPLHEKHYLMFAGGSGITPVMSIIKSILRIEPYSRITLFYANKNAESVIFGDELNALRDANAEVFDIVHVLEETSSHGKNAFVGRLDAELMRTALDRYVVSFDDTEAFVCGPGGMMDSVIASLHAHGMDDKHIHREYFKLTGETKPGETGNSDTGNGMEDEIKTRVVKVRLYGEEHEFEVHPDETILIAAQKNNLDPPYACQIGACCTCRAKIVSGKVKMDEREALSDDEIAEGYALTCQSHPLTDGVFADYDQ